MGSHLVLPWPGQGETEPVSPPWLVGRRMGRDAIAGAEGEGGVSGPGGH